MGWFTLLGILLTVLLPDDPAARQPASLKEQRRAAANRPRRLLLDNDGNDVVTMKALTAQEFLAQRTAALAGSKVDCIFYCSTATFGLSTRPSKVWQPRDYRASGRQAYSVAEMEAAGLDSLKLVAQFGKQHGIEVFNSVRMNDVHDHSTRADYGPPMFKHNRFKQAHPEWLLGTVEKRSRTGGWSAVNYAVPEVRDLAFAYIEESCRQYEIDGIALDFFRHPVFFPSTFAGKAATDVERAAMTDLLRRVRRLTEEVGTRRGRPLLVSVRVPDSATYCQAIGLDLEKWLADDLVDLLVVSGYFQLNDWRQSVDLGKKYGVKVYASLDESRIKDTEGLRQRSTPEAYRGRAAAAWGAGVDGVLLFNFSDASSPLMQELGDATKLRTLDKDSFASVRGIVGANGGNLPFQPYQKAETLNPANPKKLSPGKTVSARLRLGDVSDAELRRTVRLRFRPTLEPAAVQVNVNGQLLTPLTREGEWLEAIPAPTLLKAGINTVEISLVQGQQPIHWLDLMVREQRGNKAPAR